MTKDLETMPDYLSALERDLALRAEYSRSAPFRFAGGLKRPIVALAATLVFAAIGLAVAEIGSESPAYGQPRVLRIDAVDVPPPLRNGLALQLAAGWNATLTEARPIRAFGSTAYLLSGEDAWCLVAPDPDAARPSVEPVVSCVRTSEFMRIGVSVSAGTHYIAAIPQGVEPPTLTTSDGREMSLRPNQYGVVIVDGVRPGSTITLHPTNGKPRSDQPVRPV